MNGRGARIVLACWGTYGDLFPTIGLALALKARGHRPLVATCDYYRPVIDSLALDFHSLPPDIDPADTALLARVMHPRSGPKVLFQEMLMPAVRESYAALDAAVEGADLLISHPATPAAPLVGRRRGMPWLATVLSPMSFFSAYEVPDLRWPYVTWRLARAAGPKLGRWLLAAARFSTRGWMSPVERLREELGLPEAGHPLFSGQFSPHGTLAMFPSVLAEPQLDWPPQVTRTGFVPYNGPEAMPAELARFLDEGPAPIVFTLGTSAAGVPVPFYRESAQAAAALGARAVLLTGKNGANRLSGSLPPGVIAVDYAPHAELFPRAAAIVHQAGMGTTAQALRAGKPTLCVPYANDQPENARRVERLGVGRTLYPGRYGSRRVAQELNVLLGNAQHRSRAQTVGQAVRAVVPHAARPTEMVEAKVVEKNFGSGHA